MHRFEVAIVATVFCSVSFVSCTKPEVSDDAMANDIKAKLFSDQATKSANINVAVKGGLVTLTGDVPSADVALEAMRVANGTTGIRSVADQLTINGAAAANQLPDQGNAASETTGNATPPPTAVPNNVPSATSSSANTPVPARLPSPMQTPPPSADRAALPPRVDHEREREPVPVEIPVGAEVSVRTIDAVNSKTDQAGQTFRGSLNAPLRADGRSVIPAGSDVTLELASAKSSGRFAGRPELEIRLSSIEYHGSRYRVDSTVYTGTGASRGRQTAVRTGIGAVAGTLIGAIAGGGKGAAIGALAGGGAGAGSDFFTHGPQVKIPAESVLTFRLEAPLRVEHK